MSAPVPGGSVLAIRITRAVLPERPLVDVPPELLPLAEEVGLARTDRVRAALARRLGSMVVVAEAVRRRHNSSAILRSCEVFGVHEVHLVTTGFRVSPGASRHSERWVRMRLFPTTEESLGELRARGFRIYVADLDDDAETPESLPIDGPVALVLGSEFTGVSATARAMADGVVKVPTHGLTQSLNVSVAAAILIHVVTERIRAARGPDLPEAEQAAFLRDWLELEAKATAGWLARTEPGERPEPVEPE